MVSIRMISKDVVTYSKLLMDRVVLSTNVLGRVKGLDVESKATSTARQHALNVLLSIKKRPH